jgi:hypothetical protein
MLIALGMGALVAWTFSPHDAIGYPAGSAVSSSSNPVVAKGGRVDWSTTSTPVLTAPTGQDIVITDVVLTGAMTGYDCYGQIQVVLSTESSPTLAQYTVDQRAHPYSSASFVAAQYQSGLPIASGETLSIRTFGNFRNCSSSNYHVDYSITGYLAHP